MHDEAFEELKETIYSFEDYPCIDESHLSELEYTTCLEENFHFWVWSDLESTVQDIESPENTELDEVFELDEDTAFELIRGFFESQGYGPEYETGCTLIFDFDRFKDWYKTK